MNAQDETFEPILVHGVGKRGSLTIHRPSHEGGPTVLGYGQEMRISAEAVELGTDRLGRCLLMECLEDEAFQIVKFGEVRIRRGPWPEGEMRELPGSLAHDAAREAARLAAHALPDAAAKAEALSKMRAAFGDHRTSRTLATYDGGPNA